MSRGTGKSSAANGARTHVLCALVVVPLFLALAALGANEDPLAAIFAAIQIIGALAVIALLWNDAPARFWVRAAPCAILVALMIVWTLGANRFAPMRLAPDAAPLELLKLTGLIGGALSAGLVGCSHRRFKRLALWLAIVGLVYTLFSLWAAQAHPLTVWGQSKGAHTYRFSGTLLNANAAGCVFGMIGLVSLGLMHQHLERLDLRTSGLRDFVAVALPACGMIAALGACALTVSRTSLAVTLVLALAITALAAHRSRNKIILGASIFLLVSGAIFAGGQVTSRWDTVSADAIARADTYAYYATGVTASPLFGFGLGSFKLWNETNLTAGNASVFWPNGAAHAALLQSALEGGAPYAILILAAMFVAAGQIVAKPPGGRSLDATAVGMLAAAVLAIACSFLDIALNVPALAAFAFVLLGAVWGLRVPVRKSASPTPEPAHV